MSSNKKRFLHTPEPEPEPDREIRKSPHKKTVVEKPETKTAKPEEEEEPQQLRRSPRLKAKNEAKLKQWTAKILSFPLRFLLFC